MRSACLALGLIACSAPQALDQTSMPATGYADLRIDTTVFGVSPGDVTEVTVGPHRAYDLREEDGVLVVTVQGAPPGDVSVTLDTPDGAVDAGTLTFEPPVDAVFERFVAFGASLTQGTRDAVPTTSSQLAGPAVHIARSAGAYFPLPLLADPLLAMAPVDVENCQPPGTVDFIVGNLESAIKGLEDPEDRTLHVDRARITPELIPHNIAVGNAKIATQQAWGGADVVAKLLGRLTLEPWGDDLFAPLEKTLFERLEALEPTLLVSIDLYGNDAILPVFEGRSIRTMPTADEIGTELLAQLERLEATGAEVVLATLPDVTLLSGIQEQTSEDDQAFMRARVGEYNTRLIDAAASRDWLHVVDLATVVDSWDGGVDVGDKRLSVELFGGLISLDGVHFTDTGYAIAAEEVLKVLRADFGLDLPSIDIEAVLAQDTRSPEALASAGLTDCLP